MKAKKSGKMMAAMAAVALALTAGVAGAGWLTARVAVDEGGGRIAAAAPAAMMMGRASAQNHSVEIEEIYIPAERQREMLLACAAGDYGLAEGLLAEQADGAPGDNIYGYRAYRVAYGFTYDGGEGGSAYARFLPPGQYRNSCSVDGAEYFCLQSVSYESGSGLAEMPRLAADGADRHYYPYPLAAGESVSMVCTILVSDGEIGLPEYGSGSCEVVPAENNASIILWNVVIDGGDVTVFEGGGEDSGYYGYGVTFDESLSEPETEPETTTEETTTEPEATTEEATTQETTTQPETTTTAAQFDPKATTEPTTTIEPEPETTAEPEAETTETETTLEPTPDPTEPEGEPEPETEPIAGE